MTAFVAFLAPFRIAEGEQTPEQCQPQHAEGWMTYRDGGRAFYYRTQREARATREALARGDSPTGGYPFWPAATVYLS
jgi:hypothetical protein